MNKNVCAFSWAPRIILYRASPPRKDQEHRSQYLRTKMKYLDYCQQLLTGLRAFPSLCHLSTQCPSFYLLRKSSGGASSVSLGSYVVTKSVFSPKQFFLGLPFIICRFDNKWQQHLFLESGERLVEAREKVANTVSIKLYLKGHLLPSSQSTRNTASQQEAWQIWKKSMLTLDLPPALQGHAG